MGWGGKDNVQGNSRDQSRMLPTLPVIIFTGVLFADTYQLLSNSVLENPCSTGMFQEMFNNNFLDQLVMTVGYITTPLFHGI